MGTAHVQGSLWGARARDYAELAEGQFRLAYEAVFVAAGVGPVVLLTHAIRHSRPGQGGE